ncbi:trypsin-like peptidase domain-containing protein [Cyanobium sp. FGCU-52]|nr:trypsin-like peptidase domain-containing protein [Cyanobium sp. FGCU52]
MSILREVTDTEQRYRERAAERNVNIARIDAHDILGIAANTPDLIRKRLRRLHADPERVETLRREGLHFDPQGPGATPAAFPRALERVLDTNDLMGLRFFEQGLQVARAVGRVHISDGAGDRQGFGTGFLVAPRLLLTNHHVLSDPDQARHSKVEFNYQEGASGELQATQCFALVPQDLFLTSEELDYSLVAVADDGDLAAYGWLPLIEETGKLLVGETVNIIQHPNGEPKQLAIRNNQVVDELELFLHYRTDTDPGSSGSPVFNDQWEVVALHHSGVPKRNARGEVITSDGRVWEEWMGEQRIAWEANEGVRASRLVRHIRSQPLPPAAEALRQSLLAAQPPAAREPEPAPAPTPAPVEEHRGPQLETTSAPTAAASATWTIPLQVSVSFGMPTIGSSPTEVSQPAVAAEEGWGLFGRGGQTAAPAQPPGPFTLSSLSSPVFSWPTALSLGRASELVYRTEAEVERQARDWGFRSCDFVEQGAAQGFLAASADLVLVCFRGTESTADWLSNLKVTPKVVDELSGSVHAGFWDQFEALRAQLERLMAPHSQLPLLVTGHSLGGAIAALAAATWAPSRPLRALYTYGQPAVARGSALDQLADALAGRYHRLVNDSDIVPRVPPGYRHAGHLLYFDSKGRLVRGGAALEAALSSAAGGSSTMLSEAEFAPLQERLRRQSGPQSQEGFTTLISDHMMAAYLGKIQKQIS